jgi:uncharacterized membrane protein
MKIKYNNKNYCFSKCAKDKFQTWVIEPLLLILVLTTIAVIVYSLLAIIGFIAEGILVSFFGANALYHPGEWAALGAVATMITILLVGALQGLYKLLKAILRLIHNTYETVSAKINGTYNKRYKKSCYLFEECK